LGTFKKFLGHIRTNGCGYLHERGESRRVVYTNMIWLVTWGAVSIYTTAVAIFVPVPLVNFLLIAGFFHLGYIACFLLIKHNMAGAGKHVLILTTYSLLLVFDHLHHKETYIFLYFLAFLPAAMNIFHLRKGLPSIILYSAFPFFYILFTKLTVYSYPSFPVLPHYYVQVLSTLSIVLTFAMFVLFASYMIYNSLAKQQKMGILSASLQKTLDNSAAAIWSIDADFNLVVTNSKYAASMEREFGVTGLKPGINIRKHPIWQKLPGEFQQQYEMVLKGEEVYHETALNGRFFEVKGVPVYDKNGQVTGATFGSRDITAKKQTIEALVQAKKTAEEAGMARTRFLSNMSHEIRTPLNGIIGIVRIMQDEPFLPGQLPRLTTLQDISEHALQLVNNILDFAKMDAGKAALEHKRFHLKRFTEKINSIFLGMAKLKGITFTLDTEGSTDVYVNGDEVRLSQVLINLVGNAFKFTEKGSVTIRVKVTDVTAEACYRIYFEVTDTGIGIKQENLGTIFESFGQADTRAAREYGGTGLGLSIADRILKLMNAQIKVQSKYGRGSSFSFELLLNKSSFVSVKNKITAATDAKQSLEHLNILLAEDNKVNQMVAKMILEKWKSRVTIAINGKDALNQVNSEKFDVVLMDLDMPVMDGYESVALIRNTFPLLPVIAVTAAAFDDMNSYLRNKGFNDVVQKPFAPDDLYNKIVAVTETV
jgi:PAS domain S-box-containing protein